MERRPRGAGRDSPQLLAAQYEERLGFLAARPINVPRQLVSL